MKIIKLALFFSIFLIASCKPDNYLQEIKNLFSSDYISTETRDSLIRKHLRVTALDRSYDVDGKTSVSFSNSSDDYIFEVKQIGIKQKNIFGNISYVSPFVSVVLKPNETVLQNDISISNGTTVQIAYALKESVIVRKSD